MSFSINVPKPNQSPSLFPAQAQTNWTRLRNTIRADHFFSDAVTTNQGTHKQVTLTNRSFTDMSPPVLPGGTNGVFYSRQEAGSPQLFWFNGVNTQQITNAPVVNPTPVLAAVNFNGIGDPNAGIRSSFNVASVTRTAGAPVGLFTITFNAPLPNNNYVCVAMGMASSSGDNAQVSIYGSATYGNSVKVGSINIVCRKNSSDVINPTAIQLIVFGV